MGSWHKFGKVSFVNEVCVEMDEGESWLSRWITGRVFTRVELGFSKAIAMVFSSALSSNQHFGTNQFARLKE